MKKRHNKTWYLVFTLLLCGFFLTGCSSSDDDTDTGSTDNSGDESVIEPIVEPEKEATVYEVNVINATNNQPLSPVAVITHGDDFTAWTVGNSASTELEYLAEGGSNSQLLDSLTSIDTSTASGVAPIGPGGNETISITASESTQTLLTVVTMLVNTNDAFSGASSIDVSSLEKGDSITMRTHIYDAGTEINSESAGTIPGPADGGEGFNAARSDNIDTVRSHGGVVSIDDGLSTSVLNQSHRFDNPGIIITITRK